MLVAYVAVLISFLALDAIWLKAVIGPVFENDVPQLLAESPRLGVAAGFYAIYCIGIVWFAVRPALAGGGIGSAVLNGAILGLMAYGCYEATNMATLKGWTWRMLIFDIAWGTLLTATAAAIGTWAARTV
jgi:uncharacterized membrane protein